MLESSIDGTTIMEGALLSQNLQVYGNGVVYITFRYRDCNTYNNGAALNINTLFFDCDGGPLTNPDQFSAIISSPNNQFNLILNNQLAQITHNNIAPITLNNITPINITGLPLTQVDRTFSVTINSTAIQNFELSIFMENDVSVSNLVIVAAGQSDINLTNFIYGTDFTTFILSDFPNYIVQNGNTRTITFKQTVILLCAGEISAPFITQVNARIPCLCNESDYFSSNPITLNNIAGNNPIISVLASNLTPADGTTPSCAGNYNYDVNLNISGTTAQLNQIQIPFNSSTFQLQGVSIGSGDEFISINNFSNNNTNPENAIITILVEDNLDLNNPWPGFLSEFNDIPGAWFNVPSNGVLNLTVRLSLIYNCQNTTNCQNNPIRLTPLLNNQISVNYLNTCLNPVTSSLNLPAISAPNQQELTISGGCIPFNVSSVASAQFSYFVSIPLESPFLLTSGNNTLFSCSSTVYRAVLSIISPNNFTLGSISQLNINGQSATAFNIGGNLVFDLPLNSDPDVLLANFNINFILNGITCPNTETTFGSYEYLLTIQALCEDCANPCFVNMGCSEDILFVHCPGECDSRLIINPGVTIYRSTFGWHDASLYPDSPIENSDYFDDFGPLVKENQLRRLYPFDLFQIKATGLVEQVLPGLHQNLALELNYTNIPELGTDFFNLVSYEATFTQQNTEVIDFQNITTINVVTINNLNTGLLTQTIINNTTNTSITTETIINNLVATLSLTPANEQEVIGLPNTMNVRELRWQAADLLAAGININSGIWQIGFTATLRLNSINPIGNFPIDMLCQFVSESLLEGNITRNTSCDPYGASILVLIPDVEIVEQTAQSGDILLPNDAVDNPAAPHVDNTICAFRHAVGIRHIGGLGNEVDDFPFEFRPLTAWPLNISNIIGLDDLYSGPESYIAIGNSFQNSGINPTLLPPLEKGQISENYQGLVLRLPKSCPNSIGNVSFNLPINQFAYIHEGHLIPQPEVPLPIIPDDAIIPPGIGCQQLMNFPGAGVTFIPNGQSTYSFQLSASGGAQGLPVAFRIRLNPADPTIPVTLGNLVFNSVPITPLPNGWYTFPAGLPNVSANNASISITLGELNGCYSQQFQIVFDWQVFCNSAQLIEFTNQTIGASSCLSCSTIRTFQRNVSNLSNAQLSNTFTTEDCHLVWELNIANPINQPLINMSNLNLNFTTGILYENATLEVIGCNNAIQPTLQSPQFSLVQQQAPTITYINSSLEASNVQVMPGCTLRYRLTFSLAEDLCANYQIGSSILQVYLNGKNICDNEFTIQPITISNTNLNVLIQGLNNQTPSCCEANPEVQIQHICGQALGMISYINTGQDDVTLHLLIPGVSSPQIITVQPGQTGSFNDLNAGAYGLVIFNGTSGGIFTQIISIYNHTFTANLVSPEPVCAGTQVTLIPEFNPPNSSTSSPYTYNWVASSTNQSLSIASSLVISPNLTTTYIVTVNNGSCSVNTSSTISVNPILPTSVSIASLTSNNICAGISVTFTATPINGGTTPFYQWYLNGSQVGTNNSVYTTSTLLNNDQIYVQMISNAVCPSSVNNTSNTITMTVNPILTPLVVIVSSLGSSICAGDLVTFTATPINGGIDPIYQWYLNGNTVNTNNAVYVNSNLSTGDIVSLQMTNNAICANQGISNSNEITMTVNQLPTVTITSSGFICQGGTTTLLTATSPNANSFNWNNTGPTTSATYGTSIVENSVTVEDANSCQTTTNATLTSVNMPIETQIAANGLLNFCPNEPVTLSGTPPNNGYTYNWYLNDNLVFTGATYQPNQTGSVSLQINIDNAYGCNFYAANTQSIQSDLAFCPCFCDDIAQSLPEVIYVQNSTNFISQFNYGNSLVSNRCIKFKKDFTVTAEITFNNCNLIFDEGIQMIVAYGSKLNVENKTIFRGCDKMWKGILNNGKINMNGADIKDAQYGIEAVTYISQAPPWPGSPANTDQPYSILNNVTFSNNFIGFTNLTENDNFGVTSHTTILKYCKFLGGQLLPNFVNQVPVANIEGGLAGIRINNRFGLIVDGSNEFENLFNGIIVNKASLAVTDAKFKNIRNDAFPQLYNGNCAGAINLNNCAGGEYVIFSTPSAAINAFNGSRIKINSTNTANETYKMFDNCKVGVSANYSNSEVDGCRFTYAGSQITDNAIRIVQSTNGYRFKLNNNRIYSNNNGISIFWSNNPFISKLKRNLITQNTIYLDQNTLTVTPSSRFGINNSIDFAEFLSGTSYRDNDVITSTLDRNNGIHAQFVKFHSYSKNRNLRVAPSNGAGLGAEFSSRIYVGNNYSLALNNFGIIAGLGQNQAYNYTAVNNSKIVENCSQGTRFGFRFGDSNNGLVIAENNLGYHGAQNDNSWLGASLHLTSNGFIGTQDNVRNYFYFNPNDPNRTLAWDQNLTPGQNRFRVQTNLLNQYSLQNYYPQHDPEDPNDNCQSDPFFRCISLDNNNPYTTPFDCSSLIYDVDRFTTLEQQILTHTAHAYATDSLSFDMFPNVSLHNVGRSIAENVANGRLLLPDTGIYADMKLSLLQSSMAKFNKVDSLFPYNSNDSVMIFALEEIDKKLNYWDSASVSLSQNLLLDSMNFNYQTLADYNIARDSMHYYWNNWLERQVIVKYKLSVQTNLAQTINAAIPAGVGSTHESNERTINGILLQLSAQEQLELSESQKQVVESLAWLCPLSEGLAVYKARSIVYGYNSNAWFDNDSLCAIVGIQFRKAQQTTEKISKHITLNAFPNPSTDRLTINLSNGLENLPIKRIEIFNMMGQLVYETACSGTEVNLSLKSANLSSGILLIKVRDTNNHTFQTRIIYEK